MVKLKVGIQTWLDCKNELWIKIKTFVGLFPNIIQYDVTDIVQTA